MRLEGAARRAAAKSPVFLKEHGFQTLIGISTRSYDCVRQRTGVVRVGGRMSSTVLDRGAWR